MFAAECATPSHKSGTSSSRCCMHSMFPSFEFAESGIGFALHTRLHSLPAGHSTWWQSGHTRPANHPNSPKSTLGEGAVVVEGSLLLHQQQQAKTS